jgi:hypothetical protein
MNSAAAKPGSVGRTPSAPFYRRTKIEELGERHLGLCGYVEECQRRRTGTGIPLSLRHHLAPLWAERTAPPTAAGRFNHYV